MNKSTERAATNGQLQTSCYQNGKLIPAFTTGSCFPWENQRFTEPSHINFRCPPAVPWELLCSKDSSTCELLILHPSQGYTQEETQTSWWSDSSSSYQAQAVCAIFPTPSSHQGFKLTCYPVNICPFPNPRVSKWIILPLWQNICLMNCSYMAHALLHKLNAKITGVIFIQPWNKNRVWSTFNWLKIWKGFSPLKTKTRRVRDKEKFKVHYFLLGNVESWQDSNPRHLTNTWRQLLN